MRAQEIILWETSASYSPKLLIVPNNIRAPFHIEGFYFSQIAGERQAEGSLFGCHLVNLLNCPAAEWAPR